MSAVKTNSSLTPKNGIDSDKRRTFVEAIKSKVPAEVAQEIGVALSTVYKWNKQWKALGTAWLERQPPEAYAEALIALSAKHPTWGAGKLASELKRTQGASISTGSAHSILQAYLMNTRAGRVFALKAYHDEIDPVAFSNAQLEVLHKEHPYIDWPERTSTAPGRYLIHGYISLPATTPAGPDAISIILDEFDQRIHAGFYALTTHIASVIDRYMTEGRIVHVVTTGRFHYFGTEYRKHDYPILLRDRGIDHRFHKTPRPGQVLAPISCAWQRLKPYLFDLCKNNKGDKAMLNHLLQEILDNKLNRLS